MVNTFPTVGTPSIILSYVILISFVTFWPSVSLFRHSDLKVSSCYLLPCAKLTKLGGISWIWITGELEWTKEL